VDVSTEPEFAAFMGLTQAELESNFTKYIKVAAKHLRLDEKSF
jgi:hypothetical protein